MWLTYRHKANFLMIRLKFKDFFKLNTKKKVCSYLFVYQKILCIVHSV